MQKVLDDVADKLRNGSAYRLVVKSGVVPGTVAPPITVPASENASPSPSSEYMICPVLTSTRRMLTFARACCFL